MGNKLEKTVEVSAWIVTALLLIKYVPKNRIREAQVAFSFKQLITGLFGLLVVENKLISYPKRLFFKKTIKSSFTFEYFVYPALCTIFNLYYPEKKNNFIKLLYILFHSAIITVFESLALKYTKLIRYKKWTWYWSLLTMGLTNYLSHIYFRWFFKDQSSE
ncbi:CBO0543 family protein [Ornithinibacillus californiensis]|uniref:CBO0543 family protein n=1 Tax=Ornithinibacillus californiensis TaxID=161536 RepID=UPI00064DA61D|nr:CBO0543 family protein [Ornithinibacillus californiensis]